MGGERPPFGGGCQGVIAAEREEESTAMKAPKQTAEAASQSARPRYGDAPEVRPSVRPADEQTDLSHRVFGMRRKPRGDRPDLGGVRHMISGGLGVPYQLRSKYVRENALRGVGFELW